MLIRKVSVRATAPEDADLPWVDYSMLAAVRTCPMKGIVQYAAKKWPENGMRAVAAEAGTAMHLALAAWNSYKHLSLDNCSKLFGPLDAYPLSAMLEAAEDAEAAGGDGPLAFAHAALHEASGFYDSPDDKKRTLANLEAAVSYWAQQQRGSDYYPPIAVELPVEMVIAIEYADDCGVDKELTLKYIGRIDKVSRGNSGLLATDYKTTTLSLGQSYEAQYHLNAQVIGYRLMLSILYPEEQLSPYAVIEAIKLPISRNDSVVSYSRKAYRADNIEFFAKFIVQNYILIERYLLTHDITIVEQRTNACNNFFSVCPLLTGLCMQSSDTWQQIVKDLPAHDWHPHEEDAA